MDGDRLRGVLRSATQFSLRRRRVRGAAPWHRRSCGSGRNRLRHHARSGRDRHHRSVTVDVGASMALAVGTGARFRCGQYAVPGRRRDVCRQVTVGVELYRPVSRCAGRGAQRDHKSKRRLGLVDDMQRAVENGELDLVFQPQVNLATGRPVGAEALVRWNHPVEGAVRPDEFIAIAEAMGLIGTITDQVLGRALAAAADESWRWMDLRVSVNLSAHNLVQANLAPTWAHLHELASGAGCAEAVRIDRWYESRLARTEHELLIGCDMSIDNFGWRRLARSLRTPSDNEDRIRSPSLCSQRGTRRSFDRSLVPRLSTSGVGRRRETDVAADWPTWAARRHRATTSLGRSTRTLSASGS